MLIALIISLGIVGMISDVIATFMPGVLKYIFFILFILGTLFHLQDRLTKFHYKQFRFTDPFLLLVIIFLFRGLNSNFYLFSAPDIVYFGTSLEMLLADYFSPLRLFTYYPDQMAAFHKLSSGVVAYTLIFFEKPTLIDAIDSRYAIVVLSLFLFFRVLIEKSPIIIAIFVCSVMIIYGEEVFFELSLSSYFYVLILFSLAYILFVKKETSQSLVVLFLILICAKAPIFYSAFFCALLGVVIFWREISKPILLIFSIGVASVIFSWIALPASAGAPSERAFSLYNILDGQSAWFTFYGIKNFALSDPIVLTILGYFQSMPLIAVYLLLMLIIFKVYAAGLLLTAAIGYQSVTNGRGRLISTQQRMTLLMFFYLFSSFAGYLWLRNGISLSHQAHGPLLASSLVVALFCVWAAQHTQKRRLLWAPLLMLAFFPRSGIVEIPHYHVVLGHSVIGHEGNPPGVWTAGNPLPTASVGATYYKPNSSEHMIDSQLYAALLGLRLKVEDASGPPFAEANSVWPQGGWTRTD